MQAFQENRLFHAIRENDEGEVQKMLQQGFNPSTQSDGGNTLLHEAIVENKPFLLQLLLKFGAKTDISNIHGFTPLQLAAHFGDMSAMNLLLLHGADINKTTNTIPWTPLMVALSQNHLEIASWLMDHQADIYFIDPLEGWSALLIAAEHGHEEIFERLLKEGCDPNQFVTDGFAKGRSSIHLLSYHGLLSSIKMLLEVGVPANLQPQNQGLSALHWAVYNGHFKLVMLLLENGADPNLRAAGIYAMRSPLHYAVCNARVNMVPYLLSYGGNPLQTDEDGYTPIDLAYNRFKMMPEDDTRIICKLLEQNLKDRVV